MLARTVAMIEMVLDDITPDMKSVRFRVYLKCRWTRPWVGRQGGGGEAGGAMSVGVGVIHRWSEP